MADSIQEDESNPEQNPGNQHRDALAKEAQARRPIAEEAEVIDPVVEEVAEVLDEPIDTLVIDGQETQVSKDKIYETGVRALQKELTADKRLKEASEMKKEYQSLLRQSKGENYDDLAETLQLGTKEEVAEALKTLRGPDQDEIMDQVTDRIEYTAAAKWVDEEYSDVMGDEQLKRLFVAKERELFEGGDERPYKERYGTIAQELRDWKNTLTKPTQMGGEKVSRKRAASVPSGGTAPTGEETPQQRSRDDVINDMRKQRGQG